MPSSPKKARLNEAVDLPEEDTATWFKIPFEMRKIVIDEMDPKTRCRFTICSKKCEDEAKMSMKYLKSLTISRGTHPELYIGHAAHELHYCLEFIDIHNLSTPKTILVYKTICHNSYGLETCRCDIKWMKTIEGEKAEDVRRRYLNEILEKYHKSIETFVWKDRNFSMESFDLKILTNVKQIEDYSGRDIVKDGFFDISQLLGCDELGARDTQLTWDQLLQFDPSSCEIRCDEIDDKGKLMGYIHLFRHGRNGKAIKFLRVYTNYLSTSVNEVKEILEHYIFVASANFSEDGSNKLLVPMYREPFVMKLKVSYGCFTIEVD